MKVTGNKSLNIHIISKINIYLHSLIMIIILGYPLDINAQDSHSPFIDRLTGEKVYTAVTIQPKYVGPNSYVLDLFHEATKIGWAKDEFQGKILLQFIVTDKGRVVGARIKGKKVKEYTGIEKAFVRAAEKLQCWESGFYDNEKVSTMVTQLIWF